MAETNARARLICLVEILTMYSDENNILSIEEICDWLREYGYDVSKRTVLSDIKVINSTPMKVIYVNKPKKGYYLAKCYTQSAIQLIIEAVFSSDMLSEADIEYIKNYLQRNVCLPSLDLILKTTVNFNSLSPKHKMSDDVLFNLRLAIRDKKQVNLSISKITPGDRFSDAKVFEDIVVNPIFIAVSGGALALVCTRIESPKKAEFINLHRIKSASPIGTEATEFTDVLTNVVNFFDGSPSKSGSVKTEWLFIRFKAEEIETVENFFSSPVQFRKDDIDGYYIAKVFTTIDTSLIGWLFIYRKKIEIIAPSNLKNLFSQTDKA